MRFKAGIDELNHIVKTAELCTISTFSVESFCTSGSWSSGMPQTTSASPVRSAVSRAASSGIFLIVTLVTFGAPP